MGDSQYWNGLYEMKKTNKKKTWKEKHKNNAESYF